MHKDDRARQRRWRRPVLWGVAAIATAAALAAATFAFAAPRTGPDDGAKTPPTAQVEEGDLQGTKHITGTLGYADERPLVDGLGGVITELPAEGQVIDRNGVLYAVDNVGVRLLFGPMPAWRDFASGMDDGPDIRQLEENLQASGFFAGTPDESFTWATVQAIKAWQKATGQEQTGSIALGRVVFADGPVRIGRLDSAVGARAGGSVGTITGTTRVVTAELGLADQQLAVVGSTVTLNLPGNVTGTGTIQSVGAAYEKESGSGTITVVPLVITLDDPSVAGELQQTTVGVDIVSQTRSGVLSVPLEALLPLGDGAFGVQVVGAGARLRTVPVTTGLFAGGRVEVSGDLEAGDKVVIPAL